LLSLFLSLFPPFFFFLNKRLPPGQSGFHGGFVGRMMALHVECADHGPPLDLVLKSTPPSLTAHVNSIWFRQCREASFYDRLGAHLPHVPHMLLASWYWWSGDYALLLQRVQGVRVGVLLGNQFGLLLLLLLSLRPPTNQKNLCIVDAGAKRSTASSPMSTRLRLR
jgi:hypothetical protein